MGSPFTATRPSVISLSASRREQAPERAMTFATRSPVLSISFAEFFAIGMRWAIVRFMKEQDLEIPEACVE